MRFLVVNGNTTQPITDRVVAAARAAAGADVEIVGMTAPFGANVVVTEAENTVAAYAVLELLARHHRGFDAAILAISFDSGLFAAREVLPIPVVGITEAALETAAAGASAIGVITFGEASLPLYRSVFARYPAAAKIARIATIPTASTSAYVSAADLDSRVLEEVEDLARRHGITSVAICGAAIAGMAARLQPHTTSRLSDGVPAAIELLRSERIHAFTPPAADSLTASIKMTGVSDELRGLLERR